MSDNSEKIVDAQSSQPTPQTSLDSDSKDVPKARATDILVLLGVLDLIVGVIGAIIIWNNYGSKEILIGSSVYSFTQKVTDPIGVVAGIAVLLQGVFICVLFIVIASIADNLAAIKKNTQLK